MGEDCPYLRKLEDRLAGSFLEKHELYKFLGHIIYGDGIKTYPDKAILTFEKPKCIKFLRSFLGICNYYS